MKSVIELKIDAPLERIAALFADPQQNTKWMDDVERVEPISGQLGMPGSQYRLVPKKGNMVFVATVLSRNLPTEYQLILEASSATVSVKGTLVALSSDRTRLISEEVFSSRGYSTSYSASWRKEQSRKRTAGIWRHSSASRKPKCEPIDRVEQRETRQRQIGVTYAAKPARQIKPCERNLPLRGQPLTRSDDGKHRLTLT